MKTESDRAHLAWHAVCACEILGGEEVETVVFVVFHANGGLRKMQDEGILERG